MSQSNSSLGSESNQLSMEEALMLLQQKGLIIQKYMQRIGYQQTKMQELGQQIERLNWENREKQYRQQSLRTIAVKELLCSGFVQEIYLNGDIYVKGTQKQQKKCRPATGNNQNASHVQNGIKEQSQSNKRYLIKVLVKPWTDQIILSDKMQLFKDNKNQLQTPLKVSTLMELRQNGQSERQINKTSQCKQFDEEITIEEYCQSVLKEVSDLKLKLEREDQNRKKQTVLNIQKLRGLQEEKEQLRNRVSSLQAQNISLKTNVLDLTQQKAQLSQQLQNQILSARDKNISLSAQLKNLQDQIQHLKSLVKQKDQVLANSSEQIQNLKNQINLLQGQIRENQLTFQNQMRQKQNQCESIKKQNSDKQAQIKTQLEKVNIELVQTIEAKKLIEQTQQQSRKANQILRKQINQLQKKSNQQHSESQATILSLKLQIDQFNKKLISESQKSNNFSIQVQKLNNIIKQLEESNKTLSAQIQSMREKYTQIQQLLQSTKKNSREMQQLSNSQHLQGEIQRLKNQFKREKIDFQARIQFLEQQLKEKNIAYINLQQKSIKISKNKQQQIKLKQSIIQELHKEIAQLKIQLTESKELEQLLRKEKLETDQQLSNLRKSINQQEVQTSKNQINSKQTEIQSLNQQIKALNQKIRLNESQITIHLQKISELRKEINQLQSQKKFHNQSPSKKSLQETPLSSSLSLKRSNSKSDKNIADKLNQQIIQLTAKHQKQNFDNFLTITTLKQQLQDLNHKYTQLQHSNANQMNKTQSKNAISLSNQNTQNDSNIKSLAQTSCQTDPQLVWDKNFLRQTQLTLKKIHQNSKQTGQENQICLPPSLDMIAFDFNDSMSSQAQNISNISVKNKQICSNFSSSQYSKTDKQIDELFVNVHKNLTKKQQEKKHLSEQNIILPPMLQAEEEPKTDQVYNQNNLKVTLPHQPKLRPKVASYSEKNIIVQDPNEDDEDQRKKSTGNVQHLTLHPTKTVYTDPSDQLIPSRSLLTSSNTSNEIKDQNDDFYDPINDREPELENSDQPSQTYKNSLIIPNRGHSQSSSQKKHYDYLPNGSKNDTFELSKTPSSKNPPLNNFSNKASELLELKSPQNLMKSLIDKSFPIQKNPFKLSNQFINVTEIAKNVDRLEIPQVKVKNHEQSSINIIVESMDSHIGPIKDKIMSTTPGNLNITKSPVQPSPKTFSILSQNTSQKKQQLTSVKKQIQQLQDQNQDQFVTPRKKEPIDFTESLDFASLKKMQKQAQQANKSKKKHKVIYLRR